MAPQLRIRRPQQSATIIIISECACFIYYLESCVFLFFFLMCSSRSDHDSKAMNPSGLRALASEPRMQPSLLAQMSARSPRWLVGGGSQRSVRGNSRPHGWSTGLESHGSNCSKNESLINIRISESPFTGAWTQLKISTGILARVPWDRIWLFWALTPILICIPGRRWLGQMDLGLDLDPWHTHTHTNVIKFCLQFHGKLVMLQSQLCP